MEIGLFSLGNTEGSDRVGDHERLAGLVRLAEHAEALGFDVFALGENHQPAFVLSSPLLVLAHIAAATEQIGLSTAVSLITVNDPVKLAEDLATLQHLAPGRLSVMFGRGINSDVHQWYGYDPADNVAIAVEKYELFRRLWGEETVEWTGRFRPPLKGFTVVPRPLTGRLPPIWHASLRTREIVTQAARHGDGFFANYVHFTPEQAVGHVRYFRDQWAAYGHGTAAEAPVGSGAMVYLRPRSQDALREFGEHVDLSAWPTEYASVEEASRRTALTVGSPAQLLDKIATFQQTYGGYRRQLFIVDHARLSLDRTLEQLDLLAAEVLPTLRTLYP